MSNPLIRIDYDNMAIDNKKTNLFIEYLLEICTTNQIQEVNELEEIANYYRSAE